MRSNLNVPSCLVILLMTCINIASADEPTPIAGFDTWAKCNNMRSITIRATDIGLPTRGATVTKATLIPAGLQNPFGEYCLVEGDIAPISTDAQQIKFSVVLPSHWNNKMVQNGEGLGGVVESPAEAEEGGLPRLIARGYVAFGSDNGHATSDWLDASFALNNEELRNFAHEQLKKTHDVVTFLVKMRYGAAPVHSYFLGGSEGGREAFTVMQKYPEDYDGVVAVAPGYAFTADFLEFQIIRRAVQLKGGIGGISKEKADFLRRTELAACDKLDGLEDSIISNVDACKFDFKKLRCPGGKDTGAECFSDVQLATLEVMHSPAQIPYKLAGGETSLPAYTIGADWGSPPSPVGNPSPEPNNQQAADMFLRFFIMQDPKADTLAFDPTSPGKYLTRLQEVSALLDGTSVDLDKFIARGGKWILVHGLSDQGAPTSTSIDYYQKIVARYGQAQTDEFLRFYLIPGYGHGSGSFNAGYAPTLDALEDWVEHGIAPGTLTVVDANSETHGRSRPMCVYPAWPKYNGVGDPNVATSFSCAVK